VAENKSKNEFQVIFTMGQKILDLDEVNFGRENFGQKILFLAHSESSKTSQIHFFTNFQSQWDKKIRQLF
jgi:hypothetical protein